MITHYTWAFLLLSNLPCVYHILLCSLLRSPMPPPLPLSIMTWLPQALCHRPPAHPLLLGPYTLSSLLLFEMNCPDSIQSQVPHLHTESHLFLPTEGMIKLYCPPSVYISLFSGEFLLAYNYALISLTSLPFTTSFL